MWKVRIVVGVIILIGGLFREVRAQDYQASKLVRNLLKIGYPLDKEDVIALNKFEMRFDSKNRITVLEKILRDRDLIHRHENVDYFIKTEVVVDALRLLDEHDLPVTNGLIDEFNKQEGWEKREKALLAYMAAKRDIRYPTNTAYLLILLPQYENDLERIESGEASQTILDVMNCLSYLADLFIYKGDQEILNALILYLSRASGFPAEYLSHRFIDMLVLRPKVFISTVAVKDDQTIDTVMNALIFGVRNNEVRAEVKEVLQKELFTADEPNQRSCALFISKFNTQIDLAAKKALPKAPDLHSNSDQ